jgi:hypothetical protein
VIRKSSTIALAIVALASLFGADSALAACNVDFDNAPAKGLTASMVRTFHPCGATERGPFPNAETEADTDACQPVYPTERGGTGSAYNYARDGGCNVKIASKLARDCASVEGADGNPLGLPAGPCHLSQVKAKCKEIVDSLDTLIGDDDTGWTLWVLLRASIDEETNGSMTVVDLPVSFQFETPNLGDMKLATLTAEPLQDLGVFLPACTVLQILSVEIRDPEGNSFATMGGATIPQAP